MPRQKIPALLFAVLWILGAGIACTRSGSRTPKDTLVVALGAQPATLDPRVATDAGGMRIGQLLFSSLVRVGPDLKPVGDAAESWTNKGDEFIFILKPGLKFHNGRSVTAADIEYSFTAYAAKGGPFASALESARLKSVDTLDGRLRVTIQVRGARDKFLTADLPSVKILPREEIEAKGSEFAARLIGTGPYRLIGASASEIRLESTTDKPLKYMVFKIIRDDLTRYQKVLKGEIDIAQQELPPDRVPELEKDGRFQVLRYPGLSTTYILLNFKDPVLGRREAREALNKAINRDEIIRHKLAGLADEAASILTPINPYHLAGLRNPLPSTEDARRMIERLGVLGHRLVLKTSNSPQAVDTGRVLAHQLAAAGLQVDVQSFEWGTFYDDVRNGRFQLATMRWVGTLDPDIYRLAFHSREVPPGRNRGSYINKTLDRLLDSGAAEPEPRLRKTIYGQIQKIVHGDLAIIPLWHEQQVTVLKKGINGYRPTPTGDFWPLVEATKDQ